jgi:Ca-activated chloride channel family protein
LKQIAAAGKGAYVRSVAGTGDITAIYQGEILGKLKRAEQMVRREKIWIDRFQWPLAAAWLFGLLAFAVRGRTATAALLLASVMVSAPAHADDSIETLTKEQVSNPDDMELAGRLGEALFKAGRFNEASDVLSGVADRSTDAEARARARYNSGLAAYRGGRLTEALESWQRVLQDNPDHKAAQHNAAAVQAEIQKRLGQEPPPQDQDGESDEQENEESDDQQNNEPEESDPSENDGTREPQEQEPQGSDTGSAPEPQQTEPQQPSEGDDTGEAQPVPTELREMTEEQAERMFESVQEGDPRVVIDPGSRGGKDW